MTIDNQDFPEKNNSKNNNDQIIFSHEDFSSGEIKFDEYYSTSVKKLFGFLNDIPFCCVSSHNEGKPIQCFNSLNSMLVCKYAGTELFGLHHSSSSPADIESRKTSFIFGQKDIPDFVSKIAVPWIRMAQNNGMTDAELKKISKYFVKNKDYKPLNVDNNENKRKVSLR